MSDYIPGLAIITGSLEFFAAIYFLLLFKNKERGIKGMITILFFLSGYQILEAANCMGYGNKFLVRAAFADITWLPALGVYTSITFNPNKSIISKSIKNMFFLSASFFTAWFILDPSTAILKSCRSFYATYGNSYPIYTYYGMYYQLGMLLMVIFSIRAMIVLEEKRDRALVSDFTIGSIMFIIPSLGVSAVFSSLKGSMPSVMCHIAIFLSIFIVKGLLKEKAEQNLSLKNLSFNQQKYF
jgi:hypothetical protein